MKDGFIKLDKEMDMKKTIVTINFASIITFAPVTTLAQVLTGGTGSSDPMGFCMESVIDLVSPVIHSLYNTVTDVLLNSLLS